MKKLIRLSLGSYLLLCSLAAASAQENPNQAMKPPKVLVIVREFVKPGKSGSLHQKSESAFVQAMTAANWPTHYFAADSLSGQSRTLFFAGYDSFEAWEKDNLATQANPTLSAALDSAAIADGELLSGYDTSVVVYRDDLSLRSSLSIAQMRYFEISRIVIRPGHSKEWEALVKKYISGYEKAVPDARWAVFESVYGVDNGGVFLIFTPMKSLAETDRSFVASKKFEAAMGEGEMTKMEALAASCIESDQTNVFQFNPKISYPVDAWVKADPAFWAVK